MPRDCAGLGRGFGLLGVDRIFEGEWGQSLSAVLQDDGQC